MAKTTYYDLIVYRKKTNSNYSIELFIPVIVAQ